MACDECAGRNVKRRALQLVIKSGFHVQKDSETRIRFTVKKEALEKICSRTFTHSGWLQVQAEFAKDAKWHRHSREVWEIEDVRRSVRSCVDVYVFDYDDYYIGCSDDEDSEPMEPFQCAQCSFLEKVNYQLTTIIGSKIGKFMSDAVFLEIDPFRLEILYYKHNFVPHGRQLESDIVRVMTDPGSYPHFTKDDHDAIVKLWTDVHHLIGPEDAISNWTGAMWAALGIPVQVFWDPKSESRYGVNEKIQLGSSLRLYNLRIRCTQLAALTVKHLRQATWEKVDELTDIYPPWEVTELFFRNCPRGDFDKWELDTGIGTGPLLGFDEKGDLMLQDLIRNGCVRFKLEGVRYEH